jgi:hypothetical protein
MEIPEEWDAGLRGGVGRLLAGLLSESSALQLVVASSTAIAELPPSATACHDVTWYPPLSRCGSCNRERPLV